jgi:hypothetical protein
LTLAPTKRTEVSGQTGIAPLISAFVVEKWESRVGSRSPTRRRGGCDPVPGVYAHAHGDGGDDVADLSQLDRPINLVDICRALGGSALVQRLDDVSIRAWRDDLTLIRDSLSYARAILAADLAILTQTTSPETPQWQGVVDELSGVLATNWGEDEWPDPNDQAGDPEIDVDLFLRTDHLLAAHREMARVDLSSAVATAGVRALIEDQLALLTERQAAVEARLQQIRAVIIRRYREGVAAHDRPA